MKDWYETPLSFGEILDVTFRTVKENFGKFFLVMLIFMGPLFLLQGIGMVLFSGTSFLPGASAGNLFGLAAQSGNPGLALGSAPAFFGLLALTSLLMFFISLPMAFATLIIITDQIRNDKEVNIASAIKQAFSRFWALLGGSIVYGLISFGLYMGVVLIFVAFFAINGDFGAFRGLSAGRTAGLGKSILGMVVITLGAASGFIYLMTRWSFFFPAIIFEPVSPGIGKSWQLTRGFFWRLTGLYFVVSIINWIIAFVLTLGIDLILRESILTFFLNSLIYVLVMAIPAIAYAVTYFDLRVRNDAGDLKSMLGSYQGNPNANYQGNSYLNYPDNSFVSYPDETTTPNQTNAPNQTYTPNQTYMPSQTDAPSQADAPSHTDTQSQTETPKQTKTPDPADTLNSTKPPWEI